jgi:hypothetical protein
VKDAHLQLLATSSDLRQGRCSTALGDVGGNNERDTFP